MRGTVLYGTRDVRFEEVPEPKITKRRRCPMKPLASARAAAAPCQAAESALIVT